jgi:hypothetical protein
MLVDIFRQGFHIVLRSMLVGLKSKEFYCDKCCRKFGKNKKQNFFEKGIAFSDEMLYNTQATENWALSSAG